MDTQTKHFMSIDAFMRSLASNLRTRKNEQLVILDLFCGAGGAAKGYKNAGFKVCGIDIKHQPRYCGDWFIQANAIDCDYEFLDIFDFIHASPPCQKYSKASAIARKRGKQYPDLIPQTRQLLEATSKPYIMENVPEAPLRADICLDGSMFGLGVIRKRVFETNIPNMPRFPKPSCISGSVTDGDYVTVAGSGGRVGSGLKSAWSRAMGIDWMQKKELKESIPPAYTEWIAKEALLRLEADFSEIRKELPKMDMPTKPSEMTVDEILAEIVRVATALGNAEIVSLYVPHRFSRYAESRKEKEERIAALFDEIQKRTNHR